MIFDPLRLQLASRAQHGGGSLYEIEGLQFLDEHVRPRNVLDNDGESHWKPIFGRDLDKFIGSSSASKKLT